MRIRRGFTVVELLVVVSLMVLLLALLTPALHRSRELARRALCANNLRQNHGGFTAYANDYESWLPKTGHGGSGEGYWIETQLADTLSRDYLGGYESFYCPSALIGAFLTYPSFKSEASAEWWWVQWQVKANHYTYRVAGYSNNCHDTPAMSNTYRLRRAHQDGAMVMFHDGNELGPGGGVGVWSWRVAHNDQTGPEGNNVGFNDGSARWNDESAMQLRWLNGGWQVWW